MIRSFPPSADPRARILILGSMPGAESLRKQEYYAFPRNAFWRITGGIFSFDPALPYEDRLARLREHGVALWDVLQCCEREGSLDSRILRPVPNDLRALLSQCPGIRRIFCNGGASAGFFRKFFPELLPLMTRLPSTSPAAAMYSFEEKSERWKKALSDALPR